MSLLRTLVRSSSSTVGLVRQQLITSLPLRRPYASMTAFSDPNFDFKRKYVFTGSSALTQAHVTFELHRLS